MTKGQVDLIFHPVRMRLMTELVGRQMAPGQLLAAMPDIAQATLYRQIKRLLEGGLIEVVNEQVVNGATERTYAVASGRERLIDADLQDLTAEEHTRNFATFAALLIDAFSQYVQQADLKAMGADGLSYNRAVIYLSPAERVDFQKAVEELLGKVVNNPATAERQRYTLASVVIPDERSKAE